MLSSRENHRSVMVKREKEHSEEKLRVGGVGWLWSGGAAVHSEKVWQVALVKGQGVLNIIIGTIAWSGIC